MQVLNESLRRRIDQEVQKNREKDKMMIAQSKQATMGEMISMIAHQWRQPLTSVGLLSSSLRLDAEFDDMNKESVISVTNQIDEQVQYLSRTIDDFRNYFKPNKNSKKFAIQTLFEEVRSMSSHFLESNGIKIGIDPGEDFAIVSLKSELMQVMVNIVNNAKDALLERRVVNPLIELEARLDHKGVIIVIKDNAGGIEESVSERIFEPYFSTKNAKNGTGLGLYMAKTIVEEHLKGVISTFNDEKGAIFVIKLPFEIKDEK
jgi:signal transduction histidine kinase